ncbi:MAG: zinc ribbon domain-containing protein [bacterium]|nr:zinc ribbon domain-containing protein [bacterium]
MEITRYWRTQTERYRLIGSNCQNCKEVHFPQRIICPDCGHNNNEPLPSSTVVYEAPAASLGKSNGEFSVE